MKRFLSVLLIIMVFTVFLAGCGGSSKTATSEKTFKIGFLPLDTRPCCLDIPLELADISGVEVLAPNREDLTQFKDEADTDFAKNWLKENAKSCDALVISMEQLVYGGLIQSRNGSKDTASRDGALELLKNLKKDRPDVPIYLSNVLMRTYTSVFNQEDLVWWEKINEFSKAYYKAEILKDKDAQKEVSKLKEEIPTNVLDTFLNVRAVNHELNMTCINLVNEGVIDRLVICQEDCNEGGIQSVEQIELTTEINRLNLKEKVSVANGTDEAGAELIMYAVNPSGCSLSVCWLGDNADFTASYEDRKFKENLSEHCGFMNISIDENSENVVCILPPKKLQGDYATGDFKNHEAYSNQEIIDMCDKVKKLTDEGKRCYILDLDCANGGTAEFVSCLGQTMDIKNIYGYSGWNTASNSLGTLLAQIVATNGKNSDLNKVYTAERILDEVVYQSVVRPIMYKKAESMTENETGEKVNIFGLKNLDEKERWLQDEFLAQDKLIKNIFKDSLPEYRAELRWPRLFEISVKCN